MSSALDQQFHLFPTLPIEIRLKIWRSTLPPRIFEVQLYVPSDSESVISEINLDMRPMARPSLPIIFHACQESRNEALTLYRPCRGTTFGSPHAFPYNLYYPALDTLFFPMPLYMLEAYLQRNMFSAAAALEIGTPREFVLDRLSANVGDVGPIRSLAVSWADMHVKDVSNLMKALQPFTGLRELILVFFERRPDNQDIRLLSMKRGQLGATFVDPSESSVRGRYLERVLEEFIELADSLNKVFEGEDSLEVPNGEGLEGRLPQVKVKVVRFGS